MDTVRENEALLKASQGWLYYARPFEIIAAYSLHEVPGALAEVERQVEGQGRHAAGFVSFEAAPAFDPAMRTHPASDFPLLWFGLYPPPRTVPLPAPRPPAPVLEWSATVDQERYNRAIDRVREYIARGRTYQVNYTMRLQTAFDTSAWKFFLHLAQSQNRHAAYIDTGRFAICSASPELFFELDGETLTSRPMKGTARRGRTTQEDLAQAEWLRASEKNRAENVMIVDMIRNDLGRIARTGSVRVPELFRLERYPTLWQMTSTVSAQTRASLPGIFAALFPCASITGAPKISTMGIIHELETTPRRIYTGAIGYFSPGRKAGFNVAIRTALVDRQHRQAEYGVGGGIVWDSTSQDEYEEALLKARLLSAPTPPFSLLETLRWSPADGYFLKQRHIQRLLDSAGYFDFSAAGQEVEQHLERLAASFDRPQRVRLLVDRAGHIQATAAPLPPQEKPVRARLAGRPVSSQDVFLFHKTTQRSVYEAARADHPDCEDVLLHNERGELTEFTIGNLVVELDGDLVTPPVACGLLAGTLRAHLIESGTITERIVPVHRLRQCTKIYRINSVRGWEPVIIS